MYLLQQPVRFLSGRGEMRHVVVLAAVLAVSTAQPFATFPAGNDLPPFLRPPATVGPTNAPTTTPAPVTQATAAPSIVPAAAPAPSIQPQNNATSQTSAGNTSSIAGSGFIRPFGTYFVDSQCRNFVPVRCRLAALNHAFSRISGQPLLLC